MLLRAIFPFVVAAIAAGCSTSPTSPSAASGADAGQDTAASFGDTSADQTALSDQTASADQAGSGDTAADSAKDGSAADAIDAAAPGDSDSAAAPDAGSLDAVADVPVDAVADTAADADTADLTDTPDITDTAADVLLDTGPDSAPDAAADTAVDAASDVPAPVYGPFTKLGCSKIANTNADGTVNPFISPARNGQFYVSYVAKGGNLMLNWESHTTCKTVEGPLQVNKTAGDVYYWGGIAVVSDPKGNFYAVWESQTKGAHISFAWSETGKTFSAPIELVSTSTNGQDPAIWVPEEGKVHAAWRGHHPTLSQYDPYYAQGTAMFTPGKTFTPGKLVYSDAQQDDQVAVVGDSKGNLFLAWQSFDGDIYLARSKDEGKTWSPPVQVNDVKGKANVGKASFLAVTPAGKVVVSWSDTRKAKSGNENDVFADSSLDGLTFGTDVQVNDDDARYQEDPSMAVGWTGSCSGVIYAVWQDFRNKKSYDIVAARSVDGGLTWSKNEVIAGDVPGDEMNPAIAVDASCVVGVAWRDSTKNANFDIGTAYFKW